MSRRWSVIAALVLFMTLAACQSAGAGSPSPATSDGGTGTTASLAVQETDAVGAHVVDAEGLTLYVFLNDAPGEPSSCTGGCADSWPPATIAEGDVPAGNGITAEISTVERDDGNLQLTLDGRPLYRYASDAAPGDVAGEGVGGVWFVARPDGSVPDDAMQSAEPSESDDGSYDPYDE